MEEKNKVIVQPIQKGILKVQVGAIDGSTLITHRLTDEAVSQFMGRESGETKKKKLRNYDAEYESCFYYTDDKKYGFPASGFMGALLDACIPLDLPKTQIKRSVRLLGGMCELKYKKVNRRIDNPRRSGRNGTPDTRHRPEFVDWKCELIIQYDLNQITPDQIVNLINQAGFSTGIGDWRPGARLLLESSRKRAPCFVCVDYAVTANSSTCPRGIPIRPSISSPSCRRYLLRILRPSAAWRGVNSAHIDNCLPR